MKFEWTDRFGDKGCVDNDGYDSDDVDENDFLEIETSEHGRRTGCVLTKDQAMDLFLFLERALFSDEL